MLEKIQNLGDGLGHFIIPELISDGVIIDGGANLGNFISKIRQCDITSKIFAIEPGKQNFQKLIASKFDNVEFCNKALVSLKSEKEKIIFTEIEDLPEWGGVKDLYSKNQRVINSKKNKYCVEPITLFDILKSYPRIDYLKMDIEGCETDIIFEITKELAKQILQISFEVHNNDGEILKSHLESLGYTSIFKEGEVYGCLV